MGDIPQSAQKLMNYFMRLPGIGPKTAERLVFHLMKLPHDFLDDFSAGLKNLKTQIFYCAKCFCVSDYNEQNFCSICADPRRDQKIICVLSETTDLFAIEKTGEYKGLYHVLGGVINTIQGVLPASLKIEELKGRIEQEEVDEAILAFSTDANGEATALYLKDQLKNTKVKVTRLATGLPMGADIKYADPLTLLKAIKGRSA